jgi:hypothetical protein
MFLVVVPWVVVVVVVLVAALSHFSSSLRLLCSPF